MTKQIIEAEYEEELEPLIDDYDWELMKDSNPDLSEQ